MRVELGRFFFGVWFLFRVSAEQAAALLQLGTPIPGLSALFCVLFTFEACCFVVFGSGATLKLLKPF